MATKPERYVRGKDPLATKTALAQLFCKWWDIAHRTTAFPWRKRVRMRWYK